MQSYGLNVGGTVSIAVGPNGKSPVNTLVFPANPDQSFTHNLRTTVTQTLTGIFVDRFGSGIATVTLSGTTAWTSPIGRFNGQQIDGNTAARHLYRDIHLYYQNQQQAKPNSQTMTIFNDVTGEAWDVEPINQPQFQRAAGNGPLTLNYSMDFVVLKDLNAPAPTSKPIDSVVTTFTSTKSTSQHTSKQVSSAQQKATSVKQTPYKIHVVKSGETLYTISQAELPKQANKAQVMAFVDKIVALNHIANENLIFVGEQLKIPQ